MTDDVSPRKPGGVAAHLVCKDAVAAIDFYKAAFGAREMVRLVGENGLLMHAALEINGGVVMIADEFPDMNSRAPVTLGGCAVVLHLGVPDAEAAIARAVAAGATLTMPAQPMFWGDLYGQVTDPSGHIWSLATPLREPMTSAELAEAMKTAAPPHG